eukprot:TRINITY_DN12397_c0_g1_i2.p1 TRINITY_DN12397_c0_g1~~TRINITY_DN12397_c0_g1_i2.p1  ORF type:complete len:374 (+),score=31.96 TRINITY_DN12397_c0_g1_i2:493-1614(+)
MQLLVSFPDLGLPDVVFIATEKPLVSDLSEAVSAEWNIDDLIVNYSFGGKTLSRSSLVLSHGVESDSVITASLSLVLDKDTIIRMHDNPTNTRILSLIETYGDQTLMLDTPTFATDGCLEIFTKWMSNIRISTYRLCNPDTSVVSVGPNFLSASTVTSIDLSGARHVTFVDRSFLQLCKQLASIDLSSLSNVTRIDRCFLSYCICLTTLDLSALSNVTAIGDSFLYCCSSITSLDLSGLSNVTTVGSSFLYECREIPSVEFGNTTNITSVGSYFLSRCISLTNLDLSGLSSVTLVGNYFLAYCYNIRSLDLKGLSSVTELGSHFVDGCMRLPSLNLECLENVVKVDVATFRASMYIDEKCKKVILDRVLSNAT